MAINVVLWIAFEIYINRFVIYCQEIFANFVKKAICTVMGSESNPP